MKFVGHLAGILAASMIIKWLLDGSLELARLWYVGAFGVAVLVICVCGFIASVRLYSFFCKPTIVSGRVNRKVLETQYEMDIESGGAYEPEGKKYEIRVNNKAFELTRKVYKWVALGDFVAVTYIPPTSEVTWVDDKASARRISAEAYYESSQYSKAIREYTIAIYLNHTHAETYHKRGLAYAANGEDSLAIVDYTQALGAQYRLRQRFSTTASKDYYDEEEQMRIATKVNQAIIYYDRGRAYSTKGKYMKAITDYTKGITLFPQYEDFYMARAEAHVALGNRDEAIIDFAEFAKRSQYQCFVELAKERIQDVQRQNTRQELKRW